jgi:NifU-like protein involved in Fe-S cluster formation
MHTISGPQREALKSSTTNAIFLLGYTAVVPVPLPELLLPDIVCPPGAGKETRRREPESQRTRMTQLSEIYNQRILEWSADIAGAERLADADGTATAHSKLCGSTITVDLKMDGERVESFGQTVKACLLGQAAASVMGRNIVGSEASELRAVGEAMRRMLKQGGPPPTGRWADLAVLEPVKDYKARHASTLLVFDAVEAALAKAEAKRLAAAQA